MLTWAPVEGAASYDLHVEQADGTKRNFTTHSTAFTPVAFYGSGIWSWQVRASFRSGGAAVSGGYSPMVKFTRHIATPSGIRTTKVRGGMALSWAPARMARRYRVEIATDDSFTRVIERVTTENLRLAPRMLRPDFDGSRRLFWRVAVLDEGNNQGGWAATPLTNARKMRLKLKRRGRETVLVKVTGTSRRAVKGASCSSARAACASGGAPGGGAPSRSVSAGPSEGGCCSTSTSGVTRPRTRRCVSADRREDHRDRHARACSHGSPPQWPAGTRSRFRVRQLRQHR